jgi:hypothetical protein
MSHEKNKNQRISLKKEMRTYFSSISKGFKEFAKPRLRIYIPLIITLQGVFYAYGVGMLRLIFISRFGFSPFVGSLIIASCGIISIGLLHILNKKADKISEKAILSSIGFATIFALIFAIFDIGWFGYIVILIFLCRASYLVSFYERDCESRGNREKSKHSLVGRVVFEGSAICGDCSDYWRT